MRNSNDRLSRAPDSPITDEERKRLDSRIVSTSSDNGLDRKIKGHKGLIVFQRAMDMAVAVHALTAEFPRTVLFSLSDQMFRSAISVPSNISEGYGRRTTGEFRHSLGIARGENNELETQLEIAGRLGFGSQEKLARAQVLNADVGRLLQKYIESVGPNNI